MPHPIWERLTRRADSPLVMGILNVTPDSFSDGGRFLPPAAAAEHALSMLAEGADLIDVGAESTRPGANDVPPDEQIRRAVPVIAAIHAAAPGAAISIDTRSAEVADAALSAGACLINDVSALRDDPRMVEVALSTGAGIVLMHRRGDARSMQEGGGPHYDDVVAEVRAFLLDRAAFAQSRGVDQARIILDPGLGFGKRVPDNLRLLRHVSALANLGYPLLIGASRKSFIGHVLTARNPASGVEPEHRLYGSLACAAQAALAGAAILRVHDVRPTVGLLHLLRAIRREDSPCRNA